MELVPAKVEAIHRTAPAEHHNHSGDSGQSPLPEMHHHDHHGQEGHMMHEMKMQSSVNLTDPMAREGSGTSWLPDSSPMYGRMFMFGDDMLMLHGAAFPRYTNVSTPPRRRSNRCAELDHGHVLASDR
jgi:hypothetical protein